MKMAQRLPNTSNNGMRMYSVYRMSDAQPDWAQDDPSQPDYIKNKNLVEKLRPVSVDGEEILDDSYKSGSLNLVSGDNVSITPQGKSIVISAKNQPERVRPVYVEGQEILDDTQESGELNLVGGNNVTLTVDGNTVVISAKSSGGGTGGGCDCPEYIEGNGIDITENIKGQREISIEPGAISDTMIESVSIEKIIQKDGTTLVLNGGNANG